MSTTEAYCGGARPSEELLERLREPKPFTAPFLVLPGSEDVGQKETASFQPDASGAFELKLAPGDYCVVRAAKRQEMRGTPPRFVDEACLRQWRKACDASWRVGRDPHPDHSFVIPKLCFGPCYRGPLPP